MKITNHLSNVRLPFNSTSMCFMNELLQWNVSRLLVLITLLEVLDQSFRLCREREDFLLNTMGIVNRTRQCAHEKWKRLTQRFTMQDNQTVDGEFVRRIFTVKNLLHFRRSHVALTSEGNDDEAMIFRMMTGSFHPITNTSTVSRL